ncbi:MAG: cupin domain-containing protein [Burkholderiaceae bacterium]
MHVIHHTHLPALQWGDERGVSAADRSRGVQAFSVRVGVLDPGARGASCMHRGELVLLVLSGAGKLLLDGDPQRFAAPCTLLIPPHRTYQIVNHGSTALQVVSVFTEAPEAGRATGA